ncbi:hypothetical protein RB195_007013 [Necator americanus]|uniref:Uncharacterized protein n=1 Tax=Necator americanus TaxID=51031 RepID=A0ABR1BV87_NECAM
MLILLLIVWVSSATAYKSTTYSPTGGGVYLTSQQPHDGKGHLLSATKKKVVHDDWVLENSLLQSDWHIEEDPDVET